jgi:hypothetical protein
MYYRRIRCLNLFVLVLLSLGRVTAQSIDNVSATAPVPAQPASTSDTSNTTGEPADNPRYLLKHLREDQIAIWTGPFKAKVGDLKWLVPFAGITTGLIMTDRLASPEATHLTSFHSGKFSDVGLAVAGGSTLGFYLIGARSGNLRLKETGVLGGEAMANGLVVNEALKYVFQREGPTENNGAGRFFQSGSQRSFPSNHATLSFAFASLFAHEYTGWLSQTLAYGGATAISLARVTSSNHFPSDVFVGGTIGYLIGRQVYRTHHDTTLDPANDPANYGTFFNGPRTVGLTGAGSTYVELDSWIYPALERLIALNIIRGPFLGLRPWTRTAVAQMLAQAQPLVEDNLEQDRQVVALYSALKTEFSQELRLVEDDGVNQSMGLESLYTNIFPIAGKPLNDSYHFGQTIINNFGRPYWQGVNAATGFTSRAEAGHFFFYARGEYEHAPGAPDYSAGVQNVILQIDKNCQFNGNPGAPPTSPCFQPASPSPTANQFRLLDTYAGFTALGNEISVGKQSLWWGPNEGGSFIFSNNAEPIYMLRINRSIPLQIPFISKFLGTIRYDNFFGKFAGNHFPADPFIYGNKISFRLTENLEVGFTRTAVIAGEGHAPLTFGDFWRSFINTNDVPASEKFSPRDPGARHGQFDFSYKLPFLRNWVTLYSDSLVHDDVSPLDAPRRAAIVPGIYLSHFPKIHRLDLRVESGYTDVPTVSNKIGQQGGHFVYWELVYHDLYTNHGNLIGSWLGRDGKGTQVWSNYWLGASTYIQLAYRHLQLSPQFINGYAASTQTVPVSTPSVLGGGTQNDYSAGARLRLRKDLELLTILQYDQWNIPLIAPNRQSDFLTSVQLTFWPKDFVKARKGQ